MAEQAPFAHMLILRLWFACVLTAPLMALPLPLSLQTTSAPPHVVSSTLTGEESIRSTSPAPARSSSIFTRTDCPIANRYAPEIQRLHRAFAPQGVAFRLVYLDAGEPVEAIRTHLREYGYDIPALRDPRHVLVSLTGARATPEAAVFTAERRMVYRGRIDDRYVDFNKVRASPTQHDLRDVVTGAPRGHAVRPRTTDAVGCFIADPR